MTGTVLLAGSSAGGAPVHGELSGGWLGPLSTPARTARGASLLRSPSGTLTPSDSPPHVGVTQQGLEHDWVPGIEL